MECKRRKRGELVDGQDPDADIRRGMPLVESTPRCQGRRMLLPTAITQLIA